MELLYKIDLEQYEEINKRNISGFSISELGENLLWGKVILINNDNLYLKFEADLLKFSYDLYDTLLKMKEKDTGIYHLYNMYQLYQIDLQKRKGKIYFTFNKKTTIAFNYKKLCAEILRMKNDLSIDLKILFKNNRNIKNFDGLLRILLADK